MVTYGSFIGVGLYIVFLGNYMINAAFSMKAPKTLGIGDNESGTSIFGSICAYIFIIKVVSDCDSFHN